MEINSTEWGLLRIWRWRAWWGRRGALCSWEAALFVSNYKERFQECFQPQSAANATQRFTKLWSIHWGRRMSRRSHQGLWWQPTFTVASGPGGGDAHFTQVQQSPQVLICLHWSPRWSSANVSWSPGMEGGCWGSRGLSKGRKHLKIFTVSG